MSVTALLTDPDAFFRARRDDPSFKGPVGAVLAAAAIGLVTAYYSFRMMSSVFESAGMDSSFILFAQIGSLVGAVLGPLIAWLLYTAAFYAISALFDGEGGFTTTLALVGWGYVPVAIRALVDTGLTLYRWEVRGVAVDLPANVDMTTESGAQQFGQAMQNLTSGPILTLSIALGIVFTLWSGFIWTFAVKHARDLTVKQAAITVAVPLSISVLLSLWSLVNAL